MDRAGEPPRSLGEPPRPRLWHTRGMNGWIASTLHAWSAAFGEREPARDGSGWGDRPKASALALSLLVLLSLLGACGGDRVSLVDTGTACISPDPGTWPSGGQEFEADAPLYATVRLHSCLSSSCATERTSQCEILLEGDRLVISAEGSYVDESGPGRSCTSDCVPLEATCETAGPLPAGDYVVIYGNSQIPLTLPDVTGNYCLDGGEAGR